MSQDRRGNLLIEGTSAAQIAKKYGTPVYVLVERELRKRFRRFRSAFATYPRLRPQYAAKVNTNLEILKIAREENFEIDCSSVGEIILALIADFQPHQITFTNLHKTEQDIWFAAEIGVQAITADSLEEIKKIAHVGEKMRKKIRLFIRVNPMIKLGAYSTYDHQYGIPYAYAKRAIRLALNSPWISLTGFHFHGSYIFNPSVYYLAAKKLLNLMRYAVDMGSHITTIDLGGGFPADYTYRKSYQLEKMGKPFVRKFIKLCERMNLPLPILIFEPGKFMTTNAGLGIIKVISEKQLRKKQLVITDGATYGFVPDTMIYHWRYDILPANKMNKRRSQRYTISGCTCDSIDIIGHNYFLPRLHADDLLTIMDIGAYASVMASNFNTLKRAPVVLVREDGSTKLVRRRDRFSEMFAPELDVLKMAEPYELKEFYDIYRKDIDRIWKGQPNAPGSNGHVEKLVKAKHHG